MSSVSRRTEVKCVRLLGRFTRKYFVIQQLFQPWLGSLRSKYLIIQIQSAQIVELVLNQVMSEAVVDSFVFELVIFLLKTYFCLELQIYGSMSY